MEDNCVSTGAAAVAAAPATTSTAVADAVVVVVADLLAAMLAQWSSFMSTKDMKGLRTGLGDENGLGLGDAGERDDDDGTDDAFDIN